MANRLKQEPVEEAPKKERKSSSKSDSRMSKFMRYVFSGEFLFASNMRKSPLWFVIYVVLLILIYIGMRFEPIKRYNSMRRLNNELVNCHYRNNAVKAQLQQYQSLDNLRKEMVKAGFEEELTQPTIIYVRDYGRAE